MSAFLGREGVDDAADGVPQGLDGACCGLSKECLEFREGLLDGIEVGRIGWKIPQRGAGRCNQFSDALDLVAWEIVHHDDVAGCQCRRQHLSHVHPKGVSVHGTVQHEGRGHSALAQGAHERGRLPVAARSMGMTSCSNQRAPMKPGHVRRGTCFIQKDQTRGVAARLPVLPGRSGHGHVNAVLFGGPQRFFYSGSRATAQSGQPMKGERARPEPSAPTRATLPASGHSARPVGA